MSTYKYLVDWYTPGMDTPFGRATNKEYKKCENKEEAEKLFYEKCKEENIIRVLAWYIKIDAEGNPEEVEPFLETKRG